MWRVPILQFSCPPSSSSSHHQFLLTSICFINISPISIPSSPIFINILSFFNFSPFPCNTHIHVVWSCGGDCLRQLTPIGIHHCLVCDTGSPAPRLSYKYQPSATLPIRPLYRQAEVCFVVSLSHNVKRVATKSKEREDEEIFDHYYEKSVINKETTVTKLKQRTNFERTQHQDQTGFPAILLKKTKTIITKPMMLQMRRSLDDNSIADVQTWPTYHQHTHDDLTLPSLVIEVFERMTENTRIWTIGQQQLERRRGPTWIWTR